MLPTVRKSAAWPDLTTIRGDKNKHSRGQSTFGSWFMDYIALTFAPGLPQLEKLPGGEASGRDDRGAGEGLADLAEHRLPPRQRLQAVDALQGEEGESKAVSDQRREDSCQRPVARGFRQQQRARGEEHAAAAAAAAAAIAIGRCSCQTAL